jgi:polysaccharide export outer membrane protein
MRLTLSLRTFLLLAPLMLCLTHCGSPGAAIYGSQADANVVSTPAPDHYVIAPQDVLEVNVFQVPDLSKSVQVNASGDATLPLVGKIHLAGKSVVQAQKEIAERLGKKYIQSPQVTVLVAKSGQRVTVNGAVRTPKVINIEGKLTLSQAIAQAGGFSETANSNRIHVARVSDAQVEDLVYDLDTIQSGAYPDPAMQGGDIVVVEESNMRVVFKNLKDLLPFSTVAAVH